MDIIGHKSMGLILTQAKFIIIVMVMAMGVITPPVGMNVYIVKGIAKDVPLESIFRGIFPFLGALIICIALLIAFPQIATFLPRFISY